MFKRLLTLILFFLFLNIHSQNLLKSLYHLNNFPQEMDGCKKFINEICSDILIYNFITGGDGIFQFDIKSKDPIDIKLPFKDGLFLSFLDTKTKEKLSSYTCHIYYDFRYKDFYDEFELKDTTFSFESFFDLGIKLQDWGLYELTSNFLRDYKPELDYETSRMILFQELSKVLLSEEVLNFNNLLSEAEKKGYLSSETEEYMLNAILGETDYEYDEITSIFFNFFIRDKTSESKTKENIFKLFNNENILEIIEKDVLQPKIDVSLNFGGHLTVPKKNVKFSQSEFEQFPIQSIKIRVDFKNKALLVDFENKKPTTLTIIKAKYKGKKIKGTSIESRKIRLKISSLESTLQIMEYESYKDQYEFPYEIELDLLKS